MNPKPCRCKKTWAAAIAITCALCSGVVAVDQTQYHGPQLYIAAAHDGTDKPHLPEHEVDWPMANSLVTSSEVINAASAPRPIVVTPMPRPATGRSFITWSG